MKSLLSPPGLPKPGQRLDLPPYPPSADALALSRLAHRGDCWWRSAPARWRHSAWPRKSPGSPNCAYPPAAGLGNPALRRLLATPGPGLGAAGHPARRLAQRMRCADRRRLDGRHASGAARLPAGHTFFMKKGERLEARQAARQLTLAGYQHVTQVVAAGEYSVRGGLIDLFPMGTRCPTASSCSTTKSRPSAASTSIASAPCIRYPKSACCRRASSLPARPAARCSASASAKPSRATPRASGCTRMSPTASCRPASSTTCRCSSTHGNAVRLPAQPMPRCCCMATCLARSPSSGPTCKAATRCSAATARGRCCRPANCSCATRNSSSPPRPCRSIC
jgi:hypothetical protein